MKIDIYSDGSGQTSNTDGGYGWVMVVDGVKHSEGSGHLSNATNNDAELIAAIQGLDYVSKYIVDLIRFPLEEYEITLISDSEIILNWTNGKYRFKQIEKIHLYDDLRTLAKTLNVKTQWVRGHGTDVHNNRCDKLANNARKGIGIEGLDKTVPKGDSRIGTKKNAVASIWYGDKLKIIDFENGIIEDYNRDVHGKRGSIIEIREGKDR